MGAFRPADFLLPAVDDIEKWSVIACDQFTSQPEYWDESDRIVGDAPSALKLILPEARLDSSIGADEINAKMYEYLNAGIFAAHSNAFVYVERSLKDGSIRRGIVGAVELDAYEYTADTDAAVRATEKTVVERIPPRMAIRKDAPLELPHILMLADDEDDMLLGWCESRKAQLPLAYDFELMQGGGHISGWLVEGGNAEALAALEEEYCLKTAQRYASLGKAPLFYAVGDGNHSLATAKACWEEIKKTADAETLKNHPARFALVELDNIRDESQKFEPIHRIITGVNPAAFLDEMEKALGCKNGTAITCVYGGEKRIISIDCSDGSLPVAVIQNWLDSYLAENAGGIDYIHGDDTVASLAAKPESVGILLPAIDKASFFRGIVAGGVLPRKTFSMGHAEEKRYYLEARAIK